MRSVSRLQLEYHNGAKKSRANLTSCLNGTWSGKLIFSRNVRFKIMSETAWSEIRAYLPWTSYEHAGSDYHISVTIFSTITSGPEVCQNFKIRTVRKSYGFLPGHRTFNTFRNKISNFFSNSGFFFCLFVYLFGLGVFDTKFVPRDLILWKLIIHTW